MKNIIITGAAGFAGANLVEVMLQKDYQIYAIVRPGSKHNIRIQGYANVEVIELDLKELHKLITKIHVQCDAFIHLAWQGQRDDFIAQYTNVEYTITALEAAHKLGCKRFICTGSQAEYGVQRQITTENVLPNPACAYGAAKVAACYLSKRRAEQLGVEWIWGRIFSLYGKYEPAGRMLPDLINSISKKEIFKMTSGRQNWDYLDAEDAAKAIIALLQAGRAGEIYNIAHGDYKPLHVFTDKLASYFDADEYIHYGENTRKAVSLQPSVAKIKRDTGWQAEVDFLERISQLYRK